MSASSAMTTHREPIVTALQAAARRRRAADVALHALPWLAVIGAIAWRGGSRGSLMAAAAILVIATLLVAARAWRAIDAAWTARRLDALRSDMDDSAVLLWRDDATLSDLQRLQRVRLHQRLAAATPDLRPAWRARSIAASIVAAALVAGMVACWPAAVRMATGTVDPAAVNSAEASAPHLLAQRLDVRPPTYTRLPARTQTTLAVKVAQGSTLTWSLRFAPQPTSVDLVFLDGARVSMTRRGENWSAERRIERSTLYRIALPTPLQGTSPANAPSQLHRIDAIADRAPRLRVLQPDRNLTVRAAGQGRWSLLFEGEDDYGIQPSATLHLTQTEGSGENIQARSSTLGVAGQGSTTRRRYARTLDLATLGLVAGDDLIVQLEVSDNRTPAAQRTRSPSYILRWPPEADVGASGLDGLLTRTMPAYFRSQRQIIIDAEALLKQKRSLDAARFAKRSDGIGADQRALRARYSQFLGGEDEGAPSLPTNDDEDTQAGSTPAEGAHDDPARDKAADHDDGTDHEAHDATLPPVDAHDRPHEPGTPPVFGSAEPVLEEFGHIHDQPEATTLLDPQTRDTLRAALDQMWQSEVNLRVGRPDAALPSAYKALGFIKQVQEATRVYLARTAIAPPAIDEGRRLGGKRDGLADRRDGLIAASAPDPAPAAAWQAWQEAPAAARTDDSTSADAARAATEIATLDALERWARANPWRVADPLMLSAAIDAVRRAPACTDCRAALRRALWPILARPPATLGVRVRSDRAGQAYLDALDREAAP